MKSWRTILTFGLAVAFASVAMAGLPCAKDTEGAFTFPLVFQAGFLADTNTAVGNGFPWENSTFFFASFKNHYLFPSNLMNDLRGSGVASVESMQARSVSFGAGNTNVYVNFPNGAPSVVIDTVSGPNGATLSNCAVSAACPNGNDLVTAMDTGSAQDTLVTHELAVGTGNSGAGVWDTASTAFGGGTTGGDRAFGSGSFANPNWLTTALGIDQYDFVWVFGGQALPGPATVEQQIKEIIRLLLTPQGLRCSGLDLTPGNGFIEDDPIDFPNGKMWDPQQPQVTSGMPKTGDELKDGIRSAGFNLP